VAEERGSCPLYVPFLKLPTRSSFHREPPTTTPEIRPRNLVRDIAAKLNADPPASRARSVGERELSSRSTTTRLREVIAKSMGSYYRFGEGEVLSLAAHLGTV